MATKNVQFSSIHVKFANAKGIDVTKAGKQNRSFIRSNFDALVTHWPELKAAQKINRDGNRYPTTIPETVANAIVKRNVKLLAKRSAPKAKVTQEVTQETQES
jgi:hypothetical protein